MKKLIVFIKHWSKRRGINNSYRCYLNSYAYTLLIIKFIQYLLDENKHILYYNKSLSYLVFEFFEYYLFKYDISKHRVSISNPFDSSLNLCDQDNNGKNILELIDPVDPSNNVADKVGFVQFEHIRAEFIRSFEIFRIFMMEEISQTSLFDALTELPVDGSEGSSTEMIIGEKKMNDHQS